VYVGEARAPMTIRAVRGHDQALLISFAGLEDADAAGRLRNQLVYVKVSELPSLPEGEYYFHQLLNLRVLDESGRELGRLTEILETGANDVYVVTTPDGSELLLPVIADVILAVDLEKGDIRVRPQEWS
jgi:16S rRNA processing protein RimM